MPVVSPQDFRLEKALLYTQLGMVSIKILSVLGSHAQEVI